MMQKPRIATGEWCVVRGTVRITRELQTASQPSKSVVSVNQRITEFYRVRLEM